MRELSLFSGAGGGLLGTKLLGWKHLGYVEFNDYCQRVIAQRIKDGFLDEAPIFGDIRSFISEGFADSYKGLVDVVTGGFPCQPFSFAGKGLAENDPRNMWPQTLEVISRVRPRKALLENVPGLLVHAYTRRIFGDLAEIGYDCRWDSVSARSCGAPHKRERVWILATDTRSNRIQGLQSDPVSRKSRLPWGAYCGSVAELLGRPDIPKPLIRGVADGVAHRMDRTRAIGNGQVPVVAETAYKLINNQ